MHANPPVTFLDNYLLTSHKNRLMQTVKEQGNIPFHSIFFFIFGRFCCGFLKAKITQNLNVFQGKGQLKLHQPQGFQFEWNKNVLNICESWRSNWSQGKYNIFRVAHRDKRWLFCIFKHKYAAVSLMLIWPGGSWVQAQSTLSSVLAPQPVSHFHWEGWVYSLRHWWWLSSFYLHVGLQKVENENK